jgi:LPXTG-motif cell wall-anchored protein
VKRTLVVLIPGLLVAALLLAAPASAAESFLVTCTTCDKVDLIGKGLEPNTRLAVAVRDVRTGQPVIANPSYVTTDANGQFLQRYKVNLARHPSLQGTLYNSDGSDLVIAAHSRFTAPLKCGREASLPYTGAGGSTLLLLAGLSITAAGVTLVLWTRPRRRAAGTVAP